MIEINLLPEEMRKERKVQFNLDLQNSKIQLIAGGAVLGTLVALVLLLAIGASIRKGQASRLIQREQGMASQTSEAETINKDIAVLKGKIVELDGITRRRFLWAEK